MIPTVTKLLSSAQAIFQQSFGYFLSLCLYLEATVD